LLAKLAKPEKRVFPLGEKRVLDFRLLKLSALNSSTKRGALLTKNNPLHREGKTSFSLFTFHFLLSASPAFLFLLSLFLMN